VAGRRTRAKAAILAVVASLVVFSGTDGASAAPSCEQLDVDGLPQRVGPVLSDDGSTVLYVSEGQFFPLPDVFYDLHRHDLGDDSDVMLTSGDFDGASTSADGTLVAYVGRNPDPPGTDELFLYDSTGPTTTMLTTGSHRTSGAYGAVAVSGDGSHIAFASSVDLVGANADESFEVFLLDLTDDSITQLTSHPTDSDFRNEHYGVAIDHDGSHVAYIQDLSTIQIRLWTESTGTSVPITSGSTWPTRPSLSGDGTRLAYADSRPGDPRDSHREIFFHDTTTSTRTRITRTTGFGWGGNVFDRANEAPDISADGEHIAFISTRNIDGLNPSLRSEVFVYDVEPGTFRLVTEGGFSQGVSISADGSVIALQADGPLTGTGAHRANNIWLVEDGGTCTSPGWVDVRVRARGGPLLGDEVFHPAGDGQTVAMHRRRGQTAIYTVSVQNDDDAADSFYLQQPGVPDGWRVRWFLNSANVTAQVHGEWGFQTPSVAARRSAVFEVRVTPLPSLGPGRRQLAMNVRVASVTDDSADVARLVTRVP
jgi:Tol biopolymer transport system component